MHQATEEKIKIQEEKKQTLKTRINKILCVKVPNIKKTIGQNFFRFEGLRIINVLPLYTRKNIINFEKKIYYRLKMI